uniref:Uncharacterized sensor-like histidine kinase ycf26 n=1 Tax=Melanthalia intermedia TaxID=172989 RepID=A0A345UAI9_9FLOR|nr:drug sensory protein A [Melanthalia intermedia]AXI97475.1 drug sensory protein A [Melanthalia intermedia]
MSISSKTRLMILVTLVISVTASVLAFRYSTILYLYSVIANKHFYKDLASVFALNILDFAQLSDQKELMNFIEKVYLNTSAVRYVLFFDKNCYFFFGLPASNMKMQSVLQLYERLLYLENQEFFLDISLTNFNKPLNGSIVDVVIPLDIQGKSLGILNLGIDSGLVFFSHKFIRDLTVFVFVLVWFVSAVSFMFNASAANESINQLLSSIHSIASGNFNQRVSYFTSAEFETLAFSFNQMSEKLQSYEKKNADQLILEKSKLETIASIITDGVILIDTELRIVFVNKTAQKAFNWLNLDLIGDYICTYLPAHINEALLPVLNKMIKSNYLDQDMSYTQEMFINIDYSSKKTCRFLLTTVLDRAIQVLAGIVVVIQDISREAKLNDAKNQFISNISHELRTPLCNIGSFLETLLDYNDTLSCEQKKHFLTTANNEAKRLSSLVNDILDLSRLESEYDYSLTNVDLDQILSTIVNTSQIIACKNSIELIVELDPDIRLVMGHESSLFQVIANLVSNALKFSLYYGKIVLRVYKLIYSNASSTNSIDNSRFIRIEILDEGIGIAEEDQKAIFDRFVRIENNVHTLEGTGLGLSIVKNILNKHKTMVIVQSQLKVGTSMWFDLKQVE